MTAPAQPVMPEQPAAPVQPGAVVQPNIGYAQPNAAYAQPAMQPHAAHYPHPAAMGPRKKLWPFILIGGVIIAAVVAVILIVMLTGSSNSLVGTWQHEDSWFGRDGEEEVIEVQFNRNGTGMFIERWVCCCNNWRGETWEEPFDWIVSGDRLTIEERWETHRFDFEISHNGRRLTLFDSRGGNVQRLDRVR